MEFSFGGQFVNQLVSMSKNDPKLARALAQEVMEGMDLDALGAYLLRGGAAVDLLTERLMADPAGTLQDLHALETPKAKPKKKGAKKGAKSKAKKPAAKKPAAKKPVAKKAAAAKPATRKRLTRDEAEQKKAAIVAFLKKNPWSGRKEIAAVAQVNTQAVYARLMSELRNAGVVVSRGVKAKTRYAAAGAKKGKGKGKGKKGKGKGKKGKGKKGKGKGKGKK